MNYRLPAEWEPQWGVLLTWPHEGTDWRPYLDDITRTFVDITHAIAQREQVFIVAPASCRIPSEVKALRNVHVFACPSDDTWARDHGPIVLINREQDKRACEWLDFRFNGWGEKFAAARDNMIPSALWSLGGFAKKSHYEDHRDFVLEGGSIETDGKGTVFTTSQCLLAPHRNQPLTQAQIEEQLKRRLCAEHIVWLDHGNLIGDDTDGHIDTIVRCAPDDVLLYVSCDNPADEQYADFHLLERQLQSLRTPDGQPYRLLALPMPRPIYEKSGDGTDGDRLPATYANFLVLNGAVLVPTYGQSDNDMKAVSVIQQAFPDRQMIPIDARTIIRQHGSIHCLTMQMPL